ncbi:hypothetical protein ACH4ND_29400 [Streptomyces sp. NPDC017179]|uniref:hypothetical protein n=1 Tax=Streptomyces sp. NPDC017179 TaxID=3364979 RepID=UPI0037A86033
MRAGPVVAVDLLDLADQAKRILGCNYGSSVPLDDLIGRPRPLRETAEAFDDPSSDTGVRTILTP